MTELAVYCISFPESETVESRRYTRVSRDIAKAAALLRIRRLVLPGEQIGGQFGGK